MLGTPPPRDALAVSDLAFSFGARKALDGVSFTITPGETTILLGPNGAGKTTLFSIICGLYRQDAGSVAIAGRDTRKAGAGALSPLGIVFQAQTLDLDLTVRQNLRYFCALRGMARADADRRIAEELTRLEMNERLGEKIRALNGGHRRRVEIARATLHRPSILLLDEPTVGLDIPTRHALIDNLHRRGREDGTAILWATHLIDEIGDGDTVIVLHRGRIVARGKPAEIAGASGVESLSEAFAALTREKAAA